MQPDPERFSLRDIVAHLATVEQIWLGRVQRILTEENPLFPPAPLLDEERVAATPPENLALLHVTRHKIIDAISDLQDSHWLRTGRSESLGDLTLESLAVLILAHDGYHLRQVNEWLRSAR